MRYIIGIDGGGTKTLGYIANLKGSILGYHLSGPSNYHSVGKTNAKKALEDVINSLCDDNDIKLKDVEIISLGLAGVDRKEDKNVVMDILKSINHSSTILINNDAKTSLVGANGSIEGVITICGTGSISLGINSTGELIRAGGWGHIIGDEGSGYDIGKKALIAVAKACDKRGEETLLTEAIKKHLKIKKTDEIISYVYNNTNSKEKIAQLAPIVIKCFEANDEVSKQIIENAVWDLIQITETVINQLFNKNEKITISLAGGIFNNVSVIRDTFERKLKKRFSNLHIQAPLFDSGIGALILGWNLSGVMFEKEELKNEIKDVRSNG
ncbi:MAG: hypothetical protein FH751_13370 [Firmicutes bacterium]|nr:hypothetical protein [Bacillota bacterium]